MALANVALTNTFDEWRTRTNQLVVQSNVYENDMLFLYNKGNNSPSYAYANNIGVTANAFAAATIAGANTAVGAGANAFSAATIAGANNYLLAVIAGANSAVGTGANNFAKATIAGANTAVGAGANAFAAATIAGANTAVGAGANAYALSISSTSGVSFTATLNGANTAVGAGANNFAKATIAGANTAVGAGANAFASATIAGANSAVGTGANNFTRATLNGANTAARDATNLTTGTVPSARIGPGPYTGITGVGTLTAGTWNASIVGLLYGGTGSSLSASQGGVVYGTSAGMSITGAGVTGQVLTSAGTSAPTWTAQSSLSVGTATNQSGGTVSATTGSFSGSVTSTGGHILLTTQGAGAERHFKWNMTGRDVYFYGQDNSKQVGLFDSAAGISRWYTDLSGNFGVYADITAFTSDERLKTDIKPIDDALNKISKIRGVYYRHNELALSKGFEDKDYVGVIAQEVEKVLPEVIAPAPFDSDETGTSKSGENYKTVKYEKIVPLLIEAIKELSSQVESMKLEILELKK